MQGLTRFFRGKSGAPPEEPAQGGSKRPLVLIVDDEAPVREVVHRVLAQYEADLLEAASGEEALALATRHPAPLDLLVTDLRMPGMDGRQLAEALHERDRALKVLYLTGFSEDLFKLRELLPSWAAYVDKPITPEALRQAAALLLYGTTNPRGPLSREGSG